MALHRASGLVAGRPVGRHRELVYGSGPLRRRRNAHRVSVDRGLGPHWRAGGQIERLAGAVEGVAVGQHRGGVAGAQWLVQVEAQHRQNGEPVELGGGVELFALGQQTGPGAAGPVEAVGRQPGAQASGGGDLLVDPLGGFFSLRAAGVYELELRWVARHRHPHHVAH